MFAVAVRGAIIQMMNKLSTKGRALFMAVNFKLARGSIFSLNLMMD